MTAGIIDYGAGNLKSISNGVRKVGGDYEFVSNPSTLSSYSHVILPGVGSFGAAMQKLECHREPITQVIDAGTPFLGVCLGIQLLFSESEESPGVPGLGIFTGTCTRFSTSQKVPHMGWNDVTVERSHPLLDGIKTGDHFYFVHSYHAVPQNDDIVAASCDYDATFPAVIAQGNVAATQFHPEKSGETGLRILKNFLNF